MPSVVKCMGCGGVTSKDVRTVGERVDASKQVPRVATCMGCGGVTRKGVR